MTEQVKELIARLEGATGPDRQIDDAIHEMMPKPKVVEPLRYTRSIDDALTLAPTPNRGYWQIQQTQAPDSPLRHFGDPSIFRAWVGCWLGDEQGTGHIGRHDSPAIALCIAALKARSALRSPVVKLPSNEEEVVPSAVRAGR